MRNEPFLVFRTWEPECVPSLGPHSVRQTLAGQSRASRAQEDVRGCSTEG